MHACIHDAELRKSPIYTMTPEQQCPGSGQKLRPPSLEEEAQLLKYYAGKAQDMCRAFGFPMKVQATGVAFLRRFYLTRSPLRHDPKDILLAAIYLAGKVRFNRFPSPASALHIFHVPLHHASHMVLAGPSGSQLHCCSSRWRRPQHAVPRGR